MADPFHTEQIDGDLCNLGGPEFVAQVLTQVTLPPVPAGKVLQVDFSIVDAPAQG